MGVDFESGHRKQLKLCETTAAVHRELIERGMFKTCLNCDHKDPKGSTCNLYKAVPPMEVIVYGCNDWIEVIPF